jgi:hypothetical protein
MTQLCFPQIFKVHADGNAFLAFHETHVHGKVGLTAFPFGSD